LRHKWNKERMVETGGRGVSLVRLRSFACDDMHSKAMRAVFLFWGKRDGIVKFIAVETDMETSKA